MPFSHYKRRDFVKTLALGSAALSMGCISRPQKYIPQIGLQLYTLRSVILDDFAGTIKKVADMGYAGVETWGGLSEVGLENAAKTIKDAGLQVLGCHCELPAGDKRDEGLQMAEAYNSDKLIYHGAPEDGKFGNQDELDRTVESYNSVSEDLKSNGIQFGLHNHWWEFETAASGVVPFYYLLEKVSKDIIFEIDTYWASVGGIDPAKAVKDFGSRAPLLHIKDGIAKKDPREGIHVPAGSGAMDIKAIYEAGGQNIQWMVVEFDDFEIDIFEGIQKSYQFLTQNRLAKGKV